MSERFSKVNVGADIWRRIAAIEKDFSFTPDDGTHQVEKKDVATNRAYGEWNALRELADKWGLS